MKSGRLFTGYKLKDDFLLHWETPAALESTLRVGDMPSVVAWLRRVADDLEEMNTKNKSKTRPLGLVQ